MLVARRAAPLGVLLLAALFAGCGSTPPTPAPTEAWEAPEHPIVINDGRFVDTRTGDEFVVRGTNYFTIVRGEDGSLKDRFLSPAVFDGERVRTEFTGLAERGYTTVRLFIDSCNDGPGCITDSEGLDPSFLDVIAETMSIARDTGIHLLLTSNDLPEGGGYDEIADRGNSRDFPGYRNTVFLTTNGADAAAKYWDDLLTGLVERRAAFDAVLGWSIVNEQWVFTDQPPLSLASGTVTGSDGVEYDMADPEQKRALVTAGVAHYAETVAEVIRRHDPHGLVTMGFFAPQFPNPTSIGGDWYVDTAPLLHSTSLDFFDFHAYPGSDIGITQIAENFGIIDYADKPVIMGEVGAFVDQFDSAEAAGIALQEWTAESCRVGYSGWLHWGYVRAPAVVGDAAWGLIDDDGYLLDALAPANWPDPCTPSLHDTNLAKSGTATASSELPGEPAMAAVDGDPSTQWGSGQDAPQWISVTLAEASTVGTVRLHVAQYPEGRTVHRVEVSIGGGPWQQVHEFDSVTAGGDVLEADLGALAGVTGVRVTTTSSPSWVSWQEIEILEP